MAVTMRIVLAVVGTWVIANVWALFGNLGFMTVADANRSGGLDAVAFTIGVFPAIAWAYVQGLTKKLLNAGAVVPSLKTQLPISDLDGLTVWHETRLEEEDIENVPNMATANFVDLMLNTRVPADRIIDWVDQAILYTHLGADEAAAKRREALRKCGIRTASAYVKIAEDLWTRCRIEECDQRASRAGVQGARNQPESAARAALAHDRAEDGDADAQLVAVLTPPNRHSLQEGEISSIFVVERARG